MGLLKILIEFIVTFCFIYAFYYFFVIRKYQKDNKMIPIEVNIILAKNKIDYKKIDLDKMIKVVSILTSLILTISIILMSYLSKNIIVSVIVGVSLSIVISIIVYSFIGKHYKNKEKKNK